MRTEDYPVSRRQCDWFYRRSGGTVMRSPVKLNSGWFESSRKGLYVAPNLVAEAGRDFGIFDDTVRLALSNAALIDGRKVGDMGVAAAVASAVSGVPPKRLRARAESAAVRARVDASTAEFHSHRIGQRPAFILEDAIGDKAVFSGIVRIEPIAATIESMPVSYTHLDVYKRQLGDPEALYSLAPASGRYLGERDHARGRVQLEARQVVLADPARADHGDIVV